MRLKRFIIAALVAGSLVGGAVGVGASAAPNDSLANCHGSLTSGNASSGFSPGQQQKASDGTLSVQDIQGGVRYYCAVVTP